MPPKPSSEPVKPARPEPAVGQVWRGSDGVEFLIIHQSADRISIVGENFSAAINCLSHIAVNQDDTYIGKCAGFKIEESAE